MGFEQQFAHRDELIDAAIDAFEAHGYARASLNEILARAEMSKGQFYHHFASKQDLYLALVALMIARKREFFSGRPPPATASGDVFDLLRELLLAGLAFARSDPQIERFSRSFLRERGRPIFQTVMERFELGRADPLHHLIEAAHERGEFTTELSRPFVTRALVRLVSAAPELLDASDLDAFESGVDELIRFLRRALAR